VGYDIIGDIHGHARTLEALLETLGYDLVEGVYRHPRARSSSSATSSTAAPRSAA